MKLQEGFLIFYMIVVLASAAKVPGCGMKSVATGNVIGGEPTSRNSWKWLVAFRDITTNKFFCAGSLISAKHVVTAAHCFEDKNMPNHKRKSPLDIIALVGKHDLNIDNEEGSAEHKIWDILIHKDWNSKSDDYDADISLVVLETEVDLQRGYVRTICLPPASQNEVSGEGTVVGWGISERSLAKGKSHDSVPNELKLPAVTQEECLDATDDFYLALSSRMFCAGFVNQNKSICKGDNGGGFYQYDRASRAYYLAGIASAALLDPYLKCRTDTYAMFTSVGKFVDWIETKIAETEKNKWIDVEMKCQKERILHICNHSYAEYFSRNVRIRQSYASATLVNELRIDFSPSFYIFSGIGSNFPNIKKLWIGKATPSSVKYVERRNFENMEQLEELSLSNNQIMFLPDDSFEDLPNLKTLRLNNNRIKHLPEKIFNHLKNLENIYFNSNMIYSLSRYLFVENLKLERIDTFNNPGLSTNNVLFSRFEQVKLYNETENDFYRG